MNDCFHSGAANKRDIKGMILRNISFLLTGGEWLYYNRTTTVAGGVGLKKIINNQIILVRIFDLRLAKKLIMHTRINFFLILS